MSVDTWIIGLRVEVLDPVAFMSLHWSLHMGI